MSNARFSVLQSRAVEDKRISNAQFRTLAALGTFGDKDGWCFPKLATLSELLGKTKQAISHDIIELEKLGYVQIIHQRYEGGMKRSSKYRLLFDINSKAVVDTCQRHVDTVSTPEIDTVSTPEIDTLTPHINVPKEQVVEPQRPNIYVVYETEIGIITPILSELLDEIDKSYPNGWFKKAVIEAKISSTRVTLKYIEAIMRRWKADGFNPLDEHTENTKEFCVSQDGRVSL